MNWKTYKKKLIDHKVIQKDFDRYAIPVILCLICTGPTQGTLGFVLSICTFVIWVSIAVIIMKYREKDYYSNNRKIDISEDGIKIEMETTESLFRWKFFNKYQEDDDLIFVFNKKRTMPICFMKSETPNEMLNYIRNTISEKSIKNKA